MKKYNNVLMIEYGRCPPGCLDCEQACKQRADNGNSCIRTVALPEVNFYGIVKCNQCTLPECSEVCPTNAITKSNGVVRINAEKCVGCGLCTLACPYSGVFYDYSTEKAFKCVISDERPACVEACKHDVLSFSQSSDVLEHLGEDLVAHGVPLCQGCAEELALRLAMRVFGKNAILFAGPGCICPVIAATFQGGFVHVPTQVCWMTNMSAVMTGVKRYYQNIGKDTVCIGFAGDGMTADVGFQTLSGAAERAENLIYICLDNEAYMNTGIQKSGTTPIFSWTSTTPVGEKGRGKGKESKYMPLIMAFHGIPYVATATVAFPEDYAKKLEKAMAVKDGMAYVHVLAPCPTGWRAPTSQTIEISKLAVETGHFPLWEAEKGNFRFTYRPKERKPIKEFIKLMGRFSHVTDEELKVATEKIESRLQLLEHLAEGRKVS